MKKCASCPRLQELLDELEKQRIRMNNQAIMMKVERLALRNPVKTIKIDKTDYLKN